MLAKSLQRENDEGQSQLQKEIRTLGESIGIFKTEMKPLAKQESEHETQIEALLIDIESLKKEKKDFNENLV